MTFSDLLAEDRILPVLVVADAESAGPLGAALVAGGARVAEVTLRTAAATAAITTLCATTDLLVGAGTVLDPSDVDRAVAAGASFVVSPGILPSVVRRCQALEVPCLPGVATATELQTALAEGISTVKFFPAREAGGAPLIKALAGPFPSVRFVPTGGIGPEDLASYLAVPAVLAVGGSWLAPADLVARGAWDDITRRTADAMRVARPGGRDEGHGATPG